MAFLKGLDIDRIKESFESGLKTAQESISNIDMNEVVQGAKNAATTGASAVGKAIGDALQKEPENSGEKPQYRELVGLLWCMAYADGAISADEKATLEELSTSIDEDYSSYSEELEQEYGLRLLEAGKEFGHRNAVKIEAQKLVESLDMSPTDAKLLCWNLFALASSDGLDESETDLIRFIGEKARVDSAIIEELRNYSDAIIEIEKSIETLRQSDRSYSEIEPIVSEYTKREQNLIAAAESLVSDK